MGILLTILIMVLLDFYLIRAQTKIQTQKLDIPDNFMPTSTSRVSWIVSPFGGNYKGKNEEFSGDFQKEAIFAWWIPVFSVMPASLIFVILFFEVELIGILLVNKNRKVNYDAIFRLLVNF